MSWWQKKLLRYALSRTGFLDDNAIDLDNLDVTFGKQNVFHFKDVGLNIKRISKLAQLPPSLRVETARVLSLRLTVPADIYQSSIVVDVDGVELSLRLERQDEVPAQDTQVRARSPVTTRSPQHRKVQRRLHSPPPYDPGGLASSDDELLPTTQDLAKSFLKEEPMRERVQLEASVAAQTKGMEESIASESSEGADYGTGTGVGVPGFLAGFLQGIVDRLQVKVRNIRATLETELPAESGRAVPVTLELRVESVNVGEVAPTKASATDNNSDGQYVNRRHLQLSEIHVKLLSDADIFSELSELPSRSSPAASRHQTPSDLQESSHTAKGTNPTRPSTASTHRSSLDDRAPSHQSDSPDAMRVSTITADSDRFADAGDEGFSPTLRSHHSDLDIQLGDDNMSWASRRSKTNAPAEDLWNSMASEDDLPDSLLLDRASTPRAPSTRSGSPTLSRTRRNVSPYSRHLQSPGSWPRMEESHDRISRPHQSPGSWPNPGQSQRSLDESLAEGQQQTEELDTTDREAASVGDVAETAPHPEQIEDLAASKMFSHEEAQSMFMSAMSHRSMHVPGGWGSDAALSDTSSPSSRDPGLVQAHPRLEPETDIDNDLAYGELPPELGTHRSGQATPRAGSPTTPVEPPEGSVKPGRPKAEKPVLHIDSVSIWLPSDHTDAEAQHASDRSTPRHASGSSARPVIPGTFSAYSDMTASRRPKSASFTRDSSGDSSVFEARDEQSETVAAQTEKSVAVQLGTVACQLDVACGRLLYRLSLQVTDAVQSEQAPQKKNKHNANRASKSQDSAFSMSVAQTKLMFVQHAGPTIDLSQNPSDHLFKITIRDLDFDSKDANFNVQLGTFDTFLGSSRLLSFDKTREMRSSIVVSEDTPDVFVVFRNRTTTGSRAVKDVQFQTVPVNVCVNLGAFDETFSSFGGLSGVLEVGNSVLSDSGMMSSPASPKVAKGVRFEGEALEGNAAAELKLNGRIGGLAISLIGESCSVQLRTTTIKTVYRETAISATVEHAVLSGPCTRHSTQQELYPITVDVSTVRLDYLLAPQEKDLDRLLSLLTPSKDKYDTEDDILIDTLLRQRRKGAVARVAVTSVKVDIIDWSSMSSLQAMSNELSKLSAVTKYLPEDDRPGLLSLVRIKEIEARLPVNDRFGQVHVGFGDLHCAHVGLPALLALSIGTIHASQNGQLSLLHSLLPTETLPMVMMRTLGGEVEPVVKIKLFNLCVEYSVPVLLAATGMEQEADREEIVTELANSIAEFALPEKHGRAPGGSPARSNPGQTKKTKIELLVHDSAIGLQPQQNSSKGMLVFTDAHFSTLVPPEDTMTATLELRKAAIFVADEVLTGDAEEPLAPRRVPSNSAASAKLTTALSQRGFVSVGSIMAANIGVKAVDSADGKGKSVDVDVRNELLLLETCADSTQTLSAILNGLAPPAPPNKQPKYLTEPMTIEDMMASFSGEPQVKRDQPPEMMFDAEAEELDDPDTMLDLPMFEEDEDGLLAESEMESSLYGPISGMLGGVDKPDDEDDESEAFPETVESLLEDDPFEMPDTPTDTRMSDAALMRELSKQCRPSVSDQPVDLGLYEVEDLGFDALGGGQQPLGSRHRFNTPAARKKVVKARPDAELPFKLRLRDLHIIWNIYDGYDWKRTREGITNAVEQVEMRAEERKAKRRQSYNDRDDEESVIGDFLFNSIYIGVPSNHDAHELRRQINKGIDDLASETESVPMSGMSRPTTAYSASGRPLRQRQRRRLKLERSRTHKVAFELKGVSADVLVFPPDSADVVSSVDLRIKDFTIFDNVPTSTWRKFLTHQESDPTAWEMSKPMMHIELLTVKTLEQYAASEIVMHVAVLPVRLHVDQDALDFITRFFEFKDASISGSESANDQPFLQRVEIDTVDMCLDYKPKRVDYGGIRSGHYTEFKNFVILDGANIKLRHAIIYGIKGFEPLHQTLNDVWMPDIKRNQLPTVLAGLAPVRSLVNIGSGVRDVVAIPIREYKKDGRIMRSIQKGAIQFGKTTTSELARLGAKVAMGTQTFLTGAEGLLSPASASPSSRSGSGRRISSEQGWHDTTSSDDDGHEQRAISAYANQPLGIFSGLRSARRQLELDLLTAKDALIAVQGEMFESGTPGSAAAAVARHAPTVILRPVIGASKAVGTALLGVGNQIDRSNAKKIEDKYKRR